MFVTSLPAGPGARPKLMFLHCTCDLLLNENEELRDGKNESKAAA